MGVTSYVGGWHHCQHRIFGALCSNPLPFARIIFILNLWSKVCMSQYVCLHVCQSIWPGGRSMIMRSWQQLFSICPPFHLLFRLPFQLPFLLLGATTSSFSYLIFFASRDLLLSSCRSVSHTFSDLYSIQFLQSLRSRQFQTCYLSKTHGGQVQQTWHHSDFLNSLVLYNQGWI